MFWQRVFVSLIVMIIVYAINIMFDINLTSTDVILLSGIIIAVGHFEEHKQLLIILHNENINKNKGDRN